MMKKELKTAFQLLKYTYQYELNIIMDFVMLLLSVFCFFVDDAYASGILLSCNFFLVVVSNFAAANKNLSYANMVAASPYKRVLQLWLPNIWSAVTAFGTYVVMLLMVLRKVQKCPELNLLIADKLFCCALLIMFFMICDAIGFKKIVPAIVAFICYMAVFMAGISLKTPFLSVNLISSCLLSFQMILLGFVNACSIRKRLYRKTASKLDRSIMLK